MAKNLYTEPEEFFPKELRKKYKLGEYAEEENKKNSDEEKKKENESFRKHVNGK